MRRSLEDKIATFEEGDVWIGQNALACVAYKSGLNVNLKSMDSQQQKSFTKFELRNHKFWRKVKHQRIMKLLYV